MKIATIKNNDKQENADCIAGPTLATDIPNVNYDKESPLMKRLEKHIKK